MNNQASRNLRGYNLREVSCGVQSAVGCLAIGDALALPTFEVASVKLKVIKTRSSLSQLMNVYFHQPVQSR